jgi:hypothetical protein
MNVLYAGEELALDQPSIFLAGPTPRRPDVPSWRPAALGILQGLGFAGAVLVPERRDWSVLFSYLEQVEWEHAALEGCTVVAFWVPRDLERLPGFTTNVEIGRYAGSGRCVYGRPPNAPHTKYLDWLHAKLTGGRPEETLEGTILAAIGLATQAGASDDRS